MKNLDIKNFALLSGVSMGDYFLMVTESDTDGKLSARHLVLYMQDIAKPQISELTGNWMFKSIDGDYIDTGVKATAQTPVFQKQSGAIVWKYANEADTEYRTLVEIADLKFNPSDLTEEEWSKIKLNYADLTEDDKNDLRSVFLGVVNRAEQAAIGYENAKNEIYKSITSAAEANDKALKAQQAAESAQKVAEDQRDQTINYLNEVKGNEEERVRSEEARKQQETARVNAEKKRTDDWQAWFEAETSGVKALWAAWYTQTQNAFNGWFGATENEGVRKSVSDWLAEVQRLWTAFYGADSNSGIRRDWTQWLQLVTDDWGEKLTSVDGDWSAVKRTINSQWASLQKNINDDWASKQQTIDSEWSDKKTEINNAWNAWFGTDNTTGIQGEYKAWYDTIVADWSKWYKNTTTSYDQWFVAAKAQFSNWFGATETDGIRGDWAAWLASVLEDWNNLSNNVNDAVDSANAAADNANDAASHSPYVGEDKYWYVWNNTTKTYDKTDKYSKGDGFSIKKTFASIAEMEAYVNPSTATTDNPILKLGDFVMISSNVEDEDNSKLYVVTSVTSSAITYGFMTDMSGARGFTGHTPQLSIGTITTGAAGTLANVSLTENGTDANGNPKYLINFVIPKGDKGDKGDAFTYEDFTDEQIAGLQKPANDAAAVALSAAETANNKATLADNAATNANEKAELANTAAIKANTAATNANDKAALADTAAGNADEKASLANTAAVNANDKAGLADTAAGNANDLASHPNIVLSNGNWGKWNVETQTYDDTGSPSVGSFSYPRFSLLRGHIVFEDKTQPSGNNFRIIRGHLVAICGIE